MSNTKRNIIIGIVVVVVLLIFFLGKAFVGAGEVSDKGVKLTLLVKDANGVFVPLGTSNTQSTVTVGGDKTVGVSEVEFSVDIGVDPSSTVPDGASIIVTQINGEIVGTSDQRFNAAVAQAYTGQFDVTKGGVADSRIVGPIIINDSAIQSGEHPWRVNVYYKFKNAEGQDITSNTYGQIIVNIESDKCEGGTGVGICTPDGQYCSEPGGSLIPCAEGFCGIASCPCPTGTQAVNGVCVPTSCTDGLGVGQCTVNAGYCDPNTCASGTCSVVENCNECSVASCGSYGFGGVGLCSGLTCYDFYGNAALSCGVDSKCVFQNYNANVSVEVGGSTNYNATVIFRTKDITYPRSNGQWIAYAIQQGETLQGFDYTSSNEDVAGICPSGYYISTVPGSLGGTGRMYLYISPNAYLCQNKANGNHIEIYYSDASITAETGPLSIDPSREWRTNQ